LVHALLRWHDVDELAQRVAHVPLPGHVDVPVEAHRLVLREQQHLAEVAVDAVGECEVDDPVAAAERHGRLGPVAGQRLRTRPLAAGQDDRQHAFGVQIAPRSIAALRPAEMYVSYDYWTTEPPADCTGWATWAKAGKT